MAVVVGKGGIRTIEAPEVQVEHLETHLGPFGFLWLCACAVYPRLHFPLTVLLGERLAQAVGRKALPDEDEHLALCRLPWFRTGWMPDELRLALVARIPDAQRPVVRRSIEQILSEARRAARFDPATGDELEFAPPSRDWSYRLCGWLRSPIAPAELKRDAIFVRYMMGRAPTARHLVLDRRPHRVFGTSLSGWLDLPVLGGTGFAVFASVAIWIWGAPAMDRWLSTEEIEEIEIPAKEVTVFRDCAQCPEMAAIPGGTFLMGSPNTEKGRSDDEGPQREVAIEPFAIGRHEVTRDEYASFVDVTRHDSRGCSVFHGSSWIFDEKASLAQPGFRADRGRAGRLRQL